MGRAEPRLQRCLVWFVFATALAPARDDPFDVDVASVVAHNDVIYLSPARQGWEGVPLGNGRRRRLPARYSSCEQHPRDHAARIVQHEAATARGRMVAQRRHPGAQDTAGLSERRGRAGDTESRREAERDRPPAPPRRRQGRLQPVRRADRRRPALPESVERRRDRRGDVAAARVGRRRPRRHGRMHGRPDEAR